MFFLCTPYSTPKCPTLFSIRYVSVTTSCFSMEPVVNFLLIHFEQSINPVLLGPLFVSGAFASILCFNSSIAVVKPFLFTPYCSSISLILPSLRAPICPFFTFSRMVISFFSCFTFSSISLFHHGSYFLRLN